MKTKRKICPENHLRKTNTCYENTGSTKAIGSSLIFFAFPPAESGSALPNVGPRMAVRYQLLNREWLCAAKC
jgi:hypothetical protein